MKYTVVLQSPMDFAPRWILIGCALLLAGVALLLALKYLPGSALRRLKDRSPRPLRLALSKANILRELEKLQRDFDRGRVDSRAAHQRMSLLVRAFTQAVSGIPTTRMTLDELRALPFTDLERLIARLYVPEFSTLPDDRVADAIQRCKELIERWQ